MVSGSHSGKFWTFFSAIIVLLLLLPSFAAFNSAPALADAPPDLTVTGITLSPAEPVIDDTVTITVTVKNQGGSSAGVSYLVCYADSAILATKYIGSLNPGALATATFTWKAEAGSHSIRATADSSNIVVEADETNNTRSYAVTTLAPDLIVKSVTWSPAAPSRGDSTNITVVVKNQGTAASRTTNVNFFIDGSSRGYQNIYSINPNGTATVTYVWVVTSGQHVIKVIVDQAGSVKESDESNNEYTITFTTVPPDLIVSDIAWAPANPSLNDDVSVNATIMNQGPGRSDQCHFAYYIDGQLKSTMLVGALDTGVSTNVTFSFKATSEKHEIKTVIDYYNAVAESDENNNQKIVTFSTIAPDLTITGITWTPTDAAVGDTVTFTATVKNQGGGRSATAHSAWYVDGAFIGSPEIPELDAGADTTLSATWVATGGAHACAFVVDYDNTLDETDEENNKMNIAISIVPPDLLVPNISWEPLDFSIDDTVTFTVEIENQGGGMAENFYLSCYLDNDLLASIPVDSVSSGASVNRTCEWKAVNGRHTFRAVVDNNKMVTEENEDNNENAVTVAPNMPDLSVETVIWSPADIPAGSDVTFDIIIKNVGTLAAEPSRVAYYVDGAIAGYADIGQLYAGESTTVHFIWGAMAGIHKIEIIADSLDRIFEIDEANNTKIITLPPPDLTVESVTWAPANAPISNKVTFTARIKNQGPGRSIAAKVTCFIDDTAVDVVDLPEIDAGAVTTSILTWTATAGNHKVKVTADAGNRVAETDETNNSREIDFGTLTPDLVVQNVDWLMVNPLTYNKIDFSIVIKNQGTGNADAFQVTFITDNKTPGETEKVAAIAAGDNITLTWSANIVPGPHTFEVILDPENKVGELDETNNTKLLSFNTIVPDLTVRTILVEPAVILPGDNVTITVKVENRGRETAQNPGPTLSIDGAIIGSSTIAEIATGAMASFDFAWTAEGGDHDITAVADADKLIPESDETNNTRSRTISVGKATADVIPFKPTTNDENAGFIGNNWWVLLLIAAAIGGSVFIYMFRSLKKQA